MKGACPRLEVIAEISLVFFSYLFRSRLFAMLRVGDVIFDAHLANVQFGVAGLTDLETAQRQTER